MLDYTQTMALLEEMRPHYKDGFTSSERSAIENLYNKVCGKPIRRTGCSDCYRDAYIEVVTTLKRLGTMPTTSNYVLKAGVVFSEGFGSSKFYTLSNIPDEVAEKHLAKYPNDIDLFERTPSDWKERAAKKEVELGLAPADEPIDMAEAQKAAVELSKSTDNVNEVTASENLESSTSEEEKPTARRGRPASK